MIQACVARCASRRRKIDTKERGLAVGRRGDSTHLPVLSSLAGRPTHHAAPSKGFGKSHEIASSMSSIGCPHTTKTTTTTTTDRAYERMQVDKVLIHRNCLSVSPRTYLCFPSVFLQGTLADADGRRSRDPPHLDILHGHASVECTQQQQQQRRRHEQQEEISSKQGQPKCKPQRL